MFNISKAILKTTMVIYITYFDLFRDGPNFKTVNNENEYIQLV